MDEWREACVSNALDILYDYAFLIILRSEFTYTTRNKYIWFWYYSNTIINMRYVERTYNLEIYNILFPKA
jgi:hypothetical protein